MNKPTVTLEITYDELEELYMGIIYRHKIMRLVRKNASRPDHPGAIDEIIKTCGNLKVKLYNLAEKKSTINKMKLKELFTDESKWTKGAQARDKEGKPCNIFSSNAVCWSLTGGMTKCYPNFLRFTDVRTKIFNHLGKIETIQSWSDHILTTFQDIKNLVEELDI